jgi:archaeal flagellar protein FlaG
MPGEVINEAILIIASIVLIGALVGSVYVSISYIGGAMTQSSLRGSQKLLTEIQIDYATNITSTTLVAYVQNTGGAPIQYVTSSTVYFGPQNDELPIGYSTVAPSWNTTATVLNPGQTMSINITSAAPLSVNDYYSMMFVTPNGISASYTLQVA